MHLLAKELSPFNEISVYDTTQLYGEMGKFRFMQFSDHAVQGAIDLKNPKRIVLEYPRAMIHLMECNNPSFDNVFVIGHGIGTIAGHYPDKRFTVAEIDEKVVECSRSFFGCRRDNVVIGDGRRILGTEERNALDYIIVDAFTRKGTPLHLTTLEFFKMTMEKLTPRGAVIMNVMGKPKNDKLVDAIYTTLGEAYDYTKAFTLPGTCDSDIRNMIVVGSNRTIDFRPQEMAGFHEIELGRGHIIMDSY